MEKSTNTETTFIDPVCHMEVEPGVTRLVSLYQGHSYWFCSLDCRKAFEMNPQKHLEPKPLKRKGWLGRYLDRMAKANQKEFGNSAPRCH
jgi:YHS domain-containing protein